MRGINENDVEEACLGYLSELGYATVYGPEVGPGGSIPERDDWRDVALVGRLRRAAELINSSPPQHAIDAAVATLLRAESQNPHSENLRVHKLLTEGVPVEYRTPSGELRHTLVCLIDFEHPQRNDWLAVNQFTVVEAGKKRRPDVVVFVNGLPLGLIELKNPADKHATLRGGVEPTADLP